MNVKIKKIKDLGSGSGGHVELYKINSKHIAVKSLYSYNNNITKETLNDIDALIRLKNIPTIVNFLDICIGKNNTILLIMNPMESSLKDIMDQYDIKKRKDISRYILKSLLKSLVVLEELNIIHLDIKPENVLISYDNNRIPNICLTDFGLSQTIISPNNIDVRFAYTFPYQPPEYREFRSIKNPFAGDIWATAATILIFIDDKYNKLLNNNLDRLSKIKYKYQYGNLLNKMLDINELNRPNASEALQFLGWPQPNLDNIYDSYCGPYNIDPLLLHKSIKLYSSQTTNSILVHAIELFGRAIVYGNISNDDTDLFYEAISIASTYHGQFNMVSTTENTIIIMKAIKYKIYNSYMNYIIDKIIDLDTVDINMFSLPITEWFRN